MCGMSVGEAVNNLRSDEEWSALVEDSYLEVDPSKAAERFYASYEFREVWTMVESLLELGPVLDLGCGRGIASFSFAMNGAEVVAVEPDPSADIGARAAHQVLRQRGLSAPVVVAGSPLLPFRDASFSVVYVRQVLHHLGESLPEAIRDINRVLKPGGAFLATREHVVDDEKQLEEFLASHPIHQLAGGEGAFRLGEYVEAIEGAGLKVESILGPWDSVINAFPAARDADELADYPSIFLGKRLGPVGERLGRNRVARALLWRRLGRPVPGRMFSFFARKPG